MEEGTILVDPNVFFMYTYGTYRSTVVHECVHWSLHRRFFELEKLYNVRPMRSVRISTSMEVGAARASG